MNIVELKVSELIEYENNPRHNDEAVDYVANSIKEFGFKVPIVIDKNNTIIAGHTRVKASKKLGLETVPCIVADDLTEEQVKAFRLADNKVGELTEWDFAKLEAELEEIENIDMSEFSFDFDMPEMEAEIEEDDFEAEVPAEPKTKAGDIYQLGNHRVMCGDSTSREDIKKLLNGAIADMVFTDPPYGMKKEKDGVTNDNLNYDKLLEFNKKWIPLSFEFLKDMGGWYCWGIDEPLMDIYSEILKPMKKRNELLVRNYITWAKHSAQGINTKTYKKFPTESEKCWFVVKGKDWQNTNSENFNPKYEKVLEYLNEEKEKAGLTAKAIDEITKTQMHKHWFATSQFLLITEEHYRKLQQSTNCFNKSYEELKELIDESKNTQHKNHFDTNWYISDDIGLTDVWRENPVNKIKGEKDETGGHATPKPIAICTRAIRTSSRQGENVLDLFGGSGSTLIACEDSGKNAYLMELEPKWVDVIIERWEKHTGQKAELIERG